MSGRAKEGEKRERDREREMERGRDRDREDDRDREMRQESGRGKGQVREGREFVTSPVYRPRQRSPLSPLSQREREVLSPMTAFGTTEGMTAESGEPASGSAPSTTAETIIQSPKQLSSSPPDSSTSPNRGPMLTNQEDVEEKLKRMNETFLRSLEGIGKGSGSVRRRDKEKGKEKEVERDTIATRRFLVSASEDVPANPSGQQHPNSSARIPSPTSSAGSSSNNQQPGTIFYHPHQTNNTTTSHALGFEIGRGRGVVRTTANTSTSTSTSASSEAVDGGGGDGGGGSQGSEEVIGRMDFLW